MGAVDMDAVAIAGGGPVGMWLAAELKLAGVDAVVLERRPSPALAGSRAGGLHPRAIEILDQRGIADRFLAEGKPVQAGSIATTVLDVGDFPTRHPYTLGLWQNHIERILAEWIAELGVKVRYEHEVSGFAQDETGVDVELAGGGSLRAGYLVGCDGGRSLIRKAAGIEFPGWDPTTSNLIAEVELAEEPEWGIHRDDTGIHSLSRMENGGPVRVMVTERKIGSGGEPELRDLSEALASVYGTDYGVHSPTWLSRFTDTTRQAAEYRAGRVLLAGDAAHVHYPAGGQGLSLGIQDATNLGWKLAQVVKGISSDTLLDTYRVERHPPTARALRHTMALTALMRPEARIEALRDTVAEIAAFDEPRKLLGGLLSGLDVRYDLGAGHPLLGRRMPDLELVGCAGRLRVFGLLHEAKPLLLDLGEPGRFDLAPWTDRVRLVEAEYAGAWELPVLGRVPAPDAVLVRPDGHVAWVGEQSEDGLPEALEAWFGPAAGG
jgi:3-(3-hydroxy-phenyl)propionate hydroxylase